MEELLEMNIPKIVLREKEHRCLAWRRNNRSKFNNLPTQKIVLPKAVREKCKKAGVQLEIWLLDYKWTEPEAVST